MDTAAMIWIFVGLWIGPGAIAGVFTLRDQRRLRAAAPARIRAAAAMSDSQLKALTKDQFRLYKEAVEYGLSYKSGALAEDPEMFALGRRFAAEDERRLDVFIADNEERRRLEKDAAAAEALRELGI